MVLSVAVSFSARRLSEQQSNTPHRSQCHKDIHYPAEDSACAAEKPRNKVKAENTNQSPVQSADNEQNKCDLVKHR